jgi:hypothetical protein
MALNTRRAEIIDLLNVPNVKVVKNYFMLWHVGIIVFLYLKYNVLGLGAERTSKQSDDPNVWHLSSWFASPSFLIRSSCIGAQC